MLDSGVEYAVNMIIVEGIEHDFAVASGLDELIGFEHTELMGYGGLGQSEDSRNITNAKLLFKQRIENPDSCGVAEHLEQLGEIVEHILIRL